MAFRANGLPQCGGEVLYFQGCRVSLLRSLSLLAAVVGGTGLSHAAIPKRPATPAKHHVAAKRARKPAAPIAPLIATTTRSAKRTRTVTPVKAKTPRGPWRVPTSADSTGGRRVDGSDPVRPRPAAHALRRM